MALSLWIGLGGALGAIVRHFHEYFRLRALAATSPWHTMIIMSQALS
jgi:fluoride ion exporter CrcB/FEX